MTSELGYPAALVIAAVLAWAGLAKLHRPADTRESFRELGVPAPGALAAAVPLTELVTAALLVLRPRAGAALALALLAGFTILLTARLRAGAVVSCGCFGSFSAAPVSWIEVVRNGMLALCGLVALTAPAPTRPALAALVTVTAAAGAGTVVVALLGLRRDAGAVWNPGGSW